MLKRLLLAPFIVIFCVATLVTTSDRAQAKLESVQDKTGPALGDKNAKINIRKNVTSRVNTYSGI